LTAPTDNLTESERLWLASEACKNNLPVIGIIAGPHPTKLSDYWREKLKGLRIGTTVDVRLDSGHVVRTKLRAHINKVELRCTCFMEGFSSSYATGRVRTIGGWDREIKRTARASVGAAKVTESKERTHQIDWLDTRLFVRSPSCAKARAKAMRLARNAGAWSPGQSLAGLRCRLAVSVPSDVVVHDV